MKPPGEHELLTLKEAANYLGGAISPRYLMDELGQSLAGWIIGGKGLTSVADIKAFQDSIRVIGNEPVALPGIYVVGYNSFVKIGVSENVRSRVAALQTAIPVKLKTYAVLTGARQQEAALHRRFKPYRLNGEWFRKAGKLSAWIEGGCA